MPEAAGRKPPGFEVEPARNVTVAEYREVFRRVGEEWLWFSRTELSDDQLQQRLSDPKWEVYFLRSGEVRKGILELDCRNLPDVELALFGISRDLFGSGAGRFLMDQAFQFAFRHQPDRLWLHTCTLDHPKALGFYQKAGFSAYKRAIEVHDDPRLLGIMPVTAGPHVPIIG